MGKDIADLDREPIRMEHSMLMNLAISGREILLLVREVRLFAINLFLALNGVIFLLRWPYIPLTNEKC